MQTYTYRKGTTPEPNWRGAGADRRAGGRPVSDGDSNRGVAICYPGNSHDDQKSDMVGA